MAIREMSMRLVTTGLVIGAVFAGTGFLAGYSIGAKEVGDLRAQYDEQVRQTQVKYRLLIEAIDETVSNYEKEAEDAKKEIDQLRADVRNGSRRLSVAVRSCTVPTASGNDTDQTRAELDPAAADRIIAIAEEGDGAIRKLNACIDQYNAARKAINNADDIE